jgi:UDP-N-acetylglucosamine 2-epimerase
MDRTLPPDIFSRGIGGNIEPMKPYLLVVFHPITTEYGMEKDETLNLLRALADISMPTIWLWPNIDAGSDHVSKTIRSYREYYKTEWLRLIKNFSPEEYLKVLTNTACAVGNSSSFVRDSSFFGTPVVLVGNRQQGREIAENVLPVQPEHQAILIAIKQQLINGRYAQSQLYGYGYASRQIVDCLINVRPYIQKMLAYK